MEKIKEEREGITYRIDTKHTYKVYKSEYGGRAYYKAMVSKKNYDDTTSKFYIQLRFVQCQPPENDDVIRIKKGFQDLYTNSKDPYNPISVIVVQDYENTRQKEITEDEAYETYHNTLEENENEELSDDDLPF